MKNVFQPVTDRVKDISKDITKTMTETSEDNNKPLDNLKDKFLIIMKERGLTAYYLMSTLTQINNPEHTSQFKQVKYPNRVNDWLINKTKPVTLYNNLIGLRDTNKELELKLKLSKKMTNENYNVDLTFDG